jgi:transcriptional regulator with XRE-family HTH domain
MKENNFEKILGQRIFQARQRKGLSRQKLAAKSALTYGYLAGVERGTICISLVNFIRIYAALDNDPEVFSCINEFVDTASYKNSLKDERLEKQRKKNHLNYLKKWGQTIKNFREEKGFSQEELSRKIKISPDHLIALENGVFDEDITKISKILDRIGKCLGVPQYYLFPDGEESVYETVSAY